ncbi:MAG: hypothetical protein AAGK04_05110 [Planctomycetota bacterium]
MPGVDSAAFREAMGRRAAATWGLGRPSFAARFGVILMIALIALVFLVSLVILIPLAVLAMVAAVGLGLYQKVVRALGGGRRGVEGRENVRVIERR